MGVVPEGASLVWGPKIVEEGVPRGDRTLGHTDGTVCITCTLLEEAMPVLRKTRQRPRQICTKGRFTMLVLFNILLFVKRLTTFNRKLSPYDK